MDGHAYLAEAAVGLELPEQSSLRLQFDAGQLGVSGGCNLIGGAYSFDGDVLVVDEMIQTEMACDQPLMDLDQAMIELLTSRPTAALADDVLTLTSGETSLTLREEAALPLEGTTWTVTGIVDADSVSSVPGDGIATLVFHDGQVDVQSGCNSGSGPATIGETEIEFGAISTTRMACADELMELETAVLTVLDGTATFAIEGSSMQLQNGDHGLELSGSADPGA